MPEIYKIVNLETDKSYIGQTKYTATKRFKNHLYELRKGKHTNCKLQRAYYKYGEDKFDLQIIATGDFTKKELDDLEKIFIKLYGTIQHGYNIAAGGEGWNDPTGEVAKKVSKSVKDYLATEAGQQQVKNATKARVAKLRKDEHWNKLPQVREYWRDKRNGRGGNAHPGQRKVSAKFNIPRSVCERMLAHLKTEELDTVEIDKQLIYEYWNDNKNVPESNRNRWSHPGYRNISQQFNISYYQSKQLIQEFKNYGFQYIKHRV